MAAQNAQSQTQTNQTTEALQAMAALNAQVLKMANVINTRMAAAPKPVDPAQVAKTASALLDNGWAPGVEKAAAEQLLADPHTALVTLENLAVKAAQEVRKDPRLENGEMTNSKQANDTTPFGLGHNTESEADKAYKAKLRSYVRA